MIEEWKIYKITYTNQHRTSTRTWEVSNLGRVKCNGKIVEPYFHNRYLIVSSFKIHRAVAELFVPNPDNKPFIDHINTNTLDNRAENLRWVTQKENCNNPLTRKHMSEACKSRSRITFSEEAKQNMSNAHKGKTHTEETKQKMIEARKGKTHTEEAKQKISESLKEYYRKKRGN